jgi:hypothetical protein
LSEGLDDSLTLTALRMALDQRVVHWWSSGMVTMVLTISARDFAPTML